MQATELRPPRSARRDESSEDEVREAFGGLQLASLTCLSPGRVTATIRDLVGRLEPSDLPPELRDVWMAESLVMGTALAMFTPSTGGSTAIDRLVKQRKTLSPAESVAAGMLRRARFRLLRIEAAGADGARLRDLVSGEWVRTDEEAVRREFAGQAVVAWLAPMSDGREVFASTVTPLDEAGLAIAMGFVRPGRAELATPLRCAEAVFRNALQGRLLVIPGLNAPMPGEDDDLPDEIDELDEVALAWAEPGATRDPEDVKLVRGLTNLANILDLFASAAIMRMHGKLALHGAYAAMAQIQMETLVRRSAAGSGSLNLGTVEAEMNARLAADELPPGTREVFHEVRQRLGGAARPRGDAELDKLVARIQGLRAKTVEQGCTEQEALAAAEKVAELLDRYGLSLSEFDLRQQACEGQAVETDRKRAGPLDNCVPAAAAFFDCRVWGEKTRSGTLRHVFFGLPADVAAARYLYDLIEAAFTTETAAFRAGPGYAGLPSNLRRTGTNSFQIGLGRGIIAKLETLRRAREGALRGSSGRDVVVMKAGIVEDEIASLGLKLRSVKRSFGKRVLKDAYDQGHEAGLGFDYTPGIEAGVRAA